jgi:hypothetical protein
MYNYDFRELSIKIFLLVIIYSVIYYFPELEEYNNETKFNYYRSFMCLAFTCFGLHILINHFKEGISHPFSFHHYEMNEIHYIFMAYLILDIVKLLADKSTRYDLYAHHILTMGIVLSAIITDKFGYLHCIALIGEAISIVTGIDSLALEDNDNYLSYLCKKYRKQIINYIRLPLWISIIILSIIYRNKGHKVIVYGSIVGSLLMIFLDRHWNKKCDKVIQKYENNS